MSLGVVVMAWLGALGAATGGAVVVDDGLHGPPGLEILVDGSGTLTLDDVVHHPGFAPATSDEPTFGLQRQVVWARFRICAVDDTPSTWVLRATFPRPHRIEVWTLADDPGAFDVVAHAVGGLMVPRDERSVPDDDEVLLPLTHPVGTHLVRAVLEPARLRLQLGTERSFARDRSTGGVVVGLYYGIFVGLFFFNLLFGLATRDGTHLLYCVFVACIAMQIAVRDGWLPDDMPRALFTGAGLALTSLSSLAFTRRFLDVTADVTPRLHRLFAVGTAAAIIVTVPPFVGVNLAFPAMVVALLNTVLIAGAGTWQGLRGSRPAQLFVLAWAILLLSSALAMLNALGIIHAPWTTSVGVRVGAAVEMIVLALALATRVGVLRAAKEHAERALLTAHDEAERTRHVAVKRALIEAQEAERARLARDLHDGLGHALLLIKQRASTGTTDGVPAMVQDAIDDVRTMARALMPNRLADDGLPDALRLLADDVAAASVAGTDGNGTDINVLIDDDADGAARALGPRAVHVFRVVQEAVSNALRHGQARTVTVHVESDGTTLTTRVVDDGGGFGTAPPTTGTGLTSMQQRAQLLGGTLSVAPRGGGRGVEVTLTFPITGPAVGV
jgi:signal transduction histidine kinase